MADKDQCCGGQTKKEECTCEPTEVLLFPCSGGSNVGQIANQAAIELTESDVGNIFCLAGIGGNVPGIVESTKVAKRVVAIDGCGVKCAKKTLEHKGFNITDYVVVTDLDIKKNHDFTLNLKDVTTVKEAVKSSLGKK